MSTDLNTDYRIRVKVFVDLWNIRLHRVMERVRRA